MKALYGGKQIIAAARRATARCANTVRAHDILIKGMGWNLNVASRMSAASPHSGQRGTQASQDRDVQRAPRDTLASSEYRVYPHAQLAPTAWPFMQK
jgi:hypothetical protein